MKDIKVGVKKMTRIRLKIIEQTGDSLLLSKHSIQLSALFLLLSDVIYKTLTQAERTDYAHWIFGSSYGSEGVCNG